MVREVLTYINGLAHQFLGLSPTKVRDNINNFSLAC
jgi:hypothetical protein